VPDDRRIEKLSVPDALAVAVQLHQQDRLLEAEALYRNILSSVPEHPDVLHFLGVLSHQLGRNDEAVRLVRRAVAMMPAHVDALSNLGNVLRDGGKLAEAEAAYRKAVALAPDRVGPRNNLGVVLKNQGRLEEAITEYHAALAIAPEYADAHHNLAAALAAQGKYDEAVTAARRAIALRPDHSPAWRNLGHALYRSGHAAEATRMLEQWLAIDSGNPVAAHMLAAFGGRSTPERASDDYVKAVFDEFASSFDVVMDGLDYRAPTLIAERIAREVRGTAGRLDVLDAGCGTGLCGPLLRKHARRLVGVDLSEQMIACARERGDYDELVVAELIWFLQSRETSFDLIVSADTLVYIGNLAPFFAAAGNRLTPDGLLIFTIEHAADLEGIGSFRLEPSGRYSHSRSGLARDLTAAGFAPGPMTEAVVRKEERQPVAGLVVAAKKRAVT
jgi:predicted TPR repeat methyltransferase